MTPFLFSLLGLFPVLWFLHQRRNNLKYKGVQIPPGPKGSFFTGVKDQLSPFPWLQYAQWAEHYQSSVISLRVYNRLLIVLNDHRSVRDLLDKRASIYSDRPKSWMYHELCGRGSSVFNISSQDGRHGKYRRLLKSGLGDGAIREYHDLLESEADVLVQSLAREPEAFQHHLRRNVAAVIMKAAYGYTLTENYDPFISVAEEAAKISGWALAPGRWLVDYYPIVRFIPMWFPFAGFKRQGEAWRRQLESLSDVPHEWVKTQMRQGNFVESFTSRFIQSNNMDDENGEDIVKWAAGGMYAGASDTTVSAMTSFVLLMALHPEVQKQAQREIDDLCGPGKEPSLSDLHSLSYLSALYKEVLRYAPVSNLGKLLPALPHRVIQDDIYECFMIPKDSTVIANTWAILHDPELYPEPSQFNPNRFIDDALIGVGAGSKQPELNPDPRGYCFGYGRRSCPGLQFAEISSLLIMSRVLSRFNVSLPAGTDVPEIEFTPGITSHIKPFDVVIKSR
ncbi:hypothetical protein GYMLUDRAFT_161640 [Collybiopsis luxurians FD-317 M1]|uniref:Cytochrome P450 n=1 Tax=Collybiopsis luxurians FD-317 M1 TaxID=944289 RepID=A0A0D0D402_9AGAR|nr:hypothetical protein GYMLUDRAFT_161640 [Collybiopsis luxurians FD-317 M1]